MISDGGQRYHALQAMAPYDLDARASAAARLAFEPAQMDLRVHQPSPAWSRSSASVSLRELLGASLITYEQHLDTSDMTATAPSPYMQDGPLEPKAVYVQYQSHDPVTGKLAPVVVPASMSLDVFADPNWFGVMQEEEKVLEEEKVDDEEEDRQKLRSSIKGDPILMRAKPAPPPDAYFSTGRQEVLLPKVCGTGAVGPLFAACSTVSTTSRSPQRRNLQPTAYGVHNIPESTAYGVHSIPEPTAMDRGSPQQATMDTGSLQQAMAVRHVEAAGTMSSFMKACGKDKYSCPRITEIDQILKSTNGRDQAEPSSPLRPGSSREGWTSPASPRSRPSTRGGGPSPCPHEGADAAALAAQMAMYIQRMPQFHKAPLSQADAGAVDFTYYSEALGDGGGSSSGTSATAAAEEADGQALEGGLPSPTSVMPTRGSKHGEGIAVQSSGRVASKRGGQGSPGGHAYGCGRGGKRSAKQRLRDLDPHIDISKSVPTQRLHSNWPDSQRRQLARHFYGLSPAQILQEEEKDRLRGQGAVQRKKDYAAEEGKVGTEKDSAAEHAGDAKPEEAVGDQVRSAKAKARREAQRRGLERSFARNADSGTNFHRLEIRIRNVNRPERLVVGRPTERMHGDGSEFRKCVLLDSLQASRMSSHMK